MIGEDKDESWAGDLRVRATLVMHLLAEHLWDSAALHIVFDGISRDQRCYFV